MLSITHTIIDIIVRRISNRLTLDVSWDGSQQCWPNRVKDRAQRDRLRLIVQDCEFIDESEY